MASRISAGASLLASLIEGTLVQYSLDPTGKRALQVHCGAGKLLRELARLGFAEVWGIDSSRMLGVRARDGVLADPGRFVVREGRDLGTLASSSFDYCFSHQPWPYAAQSRVLWENLRETFRLLRPSGLCQVRIQAGDGIGIVDTDRQQPQAPQAPRVNYHLGSLQWMYGRAVRMRSGGRILGAAAPRAGIAAVSRALAPRVAALGFVDVQVLPDVNGRRPGDRFWLVARKPRPA